MGRPLTSHDRVLVARLQGVAARYASGAEARNAADLDEPPGNPVAELRGVTTDGWLLSVAAAMYVGGGHWYAAPALRLLVAAGADEGAARQWRHDHPPGGFRPPQQP